MSSEKDGEQQRRKECRQVLFQAACLDGVSEALQEKEDFAQAGSMRAGKRITCLYGTPQTDNNNRNKRMLHSDLVRVDD